MNPITSNIELLNLSNVSVRYGHHDTLCWSLKNIDLQIVKGEVVLFFAVHQAVAKVRCCG